MGFYIRMSVQPIPQKINLICFRKHLNRLKLAISNPDIIDVGGNYTEEFERITYGYKVCGKCFGAKYELKLIGGRSAQILTGNVNSKTVRIEIMPNRKILPTSYTIKGYIGEKFLKLESKTYLPFCYKEISGEINNKFITYNIIRSVFTDKFHITSGMTDIIYERSKKKQQRLCLEGKYYQDKEFIPILTILLNKI